MAPLEEFSPDWMELKYPKNRRGFGLGRKEREAFQMGENISKREEQMERNWGSSQEVAVGFCCGW